MARTKISEFSATPANNTDIDSINIAEGCAPSGINDAIRELMSQLKDWQSGTSNDPYVVGSSGSLTLNQGTANGVAYLNGSKVVTSGTALTFDGTTLTVDAGSTGLMAALKSSNANGGYFTGYSSGTAVWDIGTSKQTLNTGGASDLGLNTRSGSMMFGINNAEQMRLTSTGLGIGTSSPAYKLHAAEESSGGARLRLENLRTATFDGDFFGQIQFYGNDTNGSGVRASVTALCRDVSGATDLTFATASSGGSSTERARIDSSGNLLIGTTSFGNVNANALGFSPTSKYLALSHANGTSSGSGYVSFGYNTGEIGSITQTGTTAVLYNTTSDQRLKENIQDADSASSLIDALQVRKFDWKSDNSHQRYGFVAQELVTVAPEAVYQPEDTEAMMAVDYSKLVPMLVKEVQSLRARVAQLESN